MFILHIEQPVVLTSGGALVQDTETRCLNGVTLEFCCRLKTLGCVNLDDLSRFDSQLQLSLAAWGYYYEDYIRLSTGIKILQTSRETRDQDYEIRLVHSLAERRLNEKWSAGEFMRTSRLNNQENSTRVSLSTEQEFIF